MTHAADGERSSAIRASAAALEDLSVAAGDELDHLARRTRDDIARIAGLVDAVGPALRSTTSLASELGDLAAEMTRVLDGANDQIAAALRSEAASVAALLDDISGPAADMGMANVSATAGAAVTPPAGTPAFLEPDTSPAPTGRRTSDPDDPESAGAGAGGRDVDGEVDGGGDEPPPLPDLSDIAAAKGTREWAEAVVARYPRLTTDEVLAIHEYTTPHGVRRINGYLRDTSLLLPTDRAELDRLIAQAKSGLAKLPRRPGITFRGTDLPAHVLIDWTPGETIADAAFMSTSSSTSVAENFRGGGNAFITITGNSGADIQQLSEYATEVEVLFKPGTEFQVVARSWDDQQACWLLDIEEVAS